MFRLILTCLLILSGTILQGMEQKARPIKQSLSNDELKKIIDHRHRSKSVGRKPEEKKVVAKHSAKKSDVKVVKNPLLELQQRGRQRPKTTVIIPTQIQQLEKSIVAHATESESFGKRPQEQVTIKNPQIEKIARPALQRRRSKSLDLRENPELRELIIKKREAARKTEKNRKQLQASQQQIQKLPEIKIEITKQDIKDLEQAYEKHDLEKISQLLNDRADIINAKIGSFPKTPFIVVLIKSLYNAKNRNTDIPVWQLIRQRGYGSYVEPELHKEIEKIVAQYSKARQHQLAEWYGNISDGIKEFILKDKKTVAEATQVKTSLKQVNAGIRILDLEMTLREYAENVNLKADGKQKRQDLKQKREQASDAKIMAELTAGYNISKAQKERFAKFEATGFELLFSVKSQNVIKVQLDKPHIQRWLKTIVASKPYQDRFAELKKQPVTDETTNILRLQDHWNTALKTI